MSKPQSSSPPPKPRALIVFGRLPGGATERAGWFGPAAVEAAKQAAGTFGLKWVAVATDDHRKAAETLPEGVMNAKGQFSLPPATPAVIDQLEKLGGVQCPKAALAAPAAPGASPVAIGGPEASPTAPAGSLAPSVEPVGVMPPTGQEIAKSAAPKPADPDEPWTTLKVGQIVLAVAYGAKGDYAGWWEAKIVSVKDDDVKLRWHGCPASEPIVTLPRRYVAPFHSDYAKEL